MPLWWIFKYGNNIIFLLPLNIMVMKICVNIFLFTFDHFLRVYFIDLGQQVCTILRLQIAF